MANDKALMPTTKYTSDVLKVIEDVMQEGKGVADVCAALHISLDTFYRWIRLYPEMNETYGAAKARQKAHLEDIGYRAMFGEFDAEGKKFNASIYALIMRNKCDYDKNDNAKVTFNIENQQINNMSSQDIDTKINELIKGYLESDGKASGT